MKSITVAPETWMSSRFLNGWALCHLQVAAGDVGISIKGTKQELVARIARKIKAGNRRVINRFDRCDN